MDRTGVGKLRMAYLNEAEPIPAANMHRPEPRFPIPLFYNNNLYIK